jgi:uncharacterized RDD family membrane protein YckC
VTQTPPMAAPAYQGVVTRAIAFAVDAAIIDLIALTVGVGVGLALSILDVGHTTEVALLAIGGVAFVIWSIGYFATFWSTTGQTPGNRMMQIRVCDADDGGILTLRRSLVRFGALLLAALPLCAGFLPILVDARRRGLHDMLAGTVVVGFAAPKPEARRSTPGHAVSSRPAQPSS